MDTIKELKGSVHTVQYVHHEIQGSSVHKYFNSRMFKNCTFMASMSSSSLLGFSMLLKAISATWSRIFVQESEEMKSEEKRGGLRSKTRSAERRKLCSPEKEYWNIKPQRPPGFLLFLSSPFLFLLQQWKCTKKVSFIFDGCCRE
jgi:hypothetical protein